MSYSFIVTSQFLSMCLLFFNLYLISIHFSFIFSSPIINTLFSHSCMSLIQFIGYSFFSFEHLTVLVHSVYCLCFALITKSAFFFILTLPVSYMIIYLYFQISVFIHHLFTDVFNVSITKFIMFQSIQYFIFQFLSLISFFNSFIFSFVEFSL
jgi:hypothetical protein